MEDQVEWGDTVTVFFTGMHRDGSVFANADQDDPFTFTLGASEALPGFERAVVGMSPGDTKTIVIAPDRTGGGDRKQITLVVEEGSVPFDDDPSPSPDDTPQAVFALNDDMHTIAVNTSDQFEAVPEFEENLAALGEEISYQITLVRIDKKTDRMQ